MFTKPDVLLLTQNTHNRVQQEQETFVVNRRQFGAMISFHCQALHVQGHFEIWKQVFTV